MKPKGPLSRIEYEKFQALRKRVILSGCFGFGFSVVIAIMVNVLHVEPNFGVLAVGSFISVIWILLQMFKYKCPRCGAMPMTTRPSFSPEEVTVTGFVALFPKKCHKCGVLFVPPKEDALPSGQ